LPHHTHAEAAAINMTLTAVHEQATDQPQTLGARAGAHARPSWRSIAPVLLTLSLLALGASAPAAGARLRGSGHVRSAESCPDPHNPDANYLCPLGPNYLVPGLTDLGGWLQRAHWQNILYGDLTGNGAQDMVARGQQGIEVYRFNPTLGQWSQVSIPPILPDRDGWDRPQYYKTIQLGDLNGDGRAELIARGTNGIQVFRYQQGDTPATATWVRLTESGPFPDADGWYQYKYSSTIKLSTIGGNGRTMQLIGRGGSGLLMYRWNGTGWTRLADLPELSDANGWDKPEYYSTIMAWDKSLLLARGGDGMEVFQYTPQAGGPGSWKQLGDGYGMPCATTSPDPAPPSYPCDTGTIQLVHGVAGVPAEDPVLLARDSRAGYGLRLSHFYLESGGWVTGKPFPNTPRPWDKALYAAFAYSSTIQAADLEGDGHDLVLGRTINGIEVFRPDISGNYDSYFTPVNSQPDPKLADDPWAKTPGYYGTITTAKLDPASPVRSLLARGPYGVRTWRWDPTSHQFTRYRSYGSFPPIDDKTLAALSGYLGIDNGTTIRDVYATPGSDPSTDQLSDFRGSLEKTCSGPPESASPPRYNACKSSEPAVSDESWTKAANQIIAELYWAEQVTDHFNTLDGIQSKLFVNQLGELPSLEADLRLASDAVNAKAHTNNLEIFNEVLGGIAGLGIKGPEQVFDVLHTAIAIAIMASPVVDETHEREQTFADVQNGLATAQEQIQDTITSQRRYVLGDYGLLVDVGRLVASRVWTLDRQLALSAGRQGFTLAMYKAFLPVLWQDWSVTGCIEYPKGGNFTNFCDRPAPSQVVEQFPDGMVDGYPQYRFDGLLPPQTPCQGNTYDCTFKTLEEAGYGDTVKALVDPVTEACEYDPVAGTSWHYGCSLGIGLDMLHAVDVNGFPVWNFPIVVCTATYTVGGSFLPFCPVGPFGLRSPAHHRPVRPLRHHRPVFAG